MRCGGRVISPHGHSFLPTVLLLVSALLAFAVTDARPQQPQGTSSDWTPEYHKPAADWWKPQTDEDSWRAFEPVKETSTSEWWKLKLDDDLWNPKAHEITQGTLENVPPAQSEPVATTKPVDEDKGEKKVHNITAEPETKTEATTTAATSATFSTETKYLQPSNDFPLYKKGEVNSFVEPDPASYYSSSGEYYGRNSWHSSYPLLHQGSVPAAAHSKPQPLASKHNTESLVPQPSKTSSGIQQSDEAVHVESRGSGGQMTLSLLDQPPQGDQAARNTSHLVDNKYRTQQQHHRLQLEDEKPAASQQLINNNNHNSDHGSVNKNQHNAESSSEDLSVPAAGSDDQAGNKPSEPKESMPAAAGSSAVYGKGESLSYPHAAAAAAVLDTTITPDEMATSTDGTTSTNKFVDWQDWDNSVFDYYQDDEEEDAASSSSSKKEKGQPTNEDVANRSGSKSHVQIEAEDTQQDNYDQYEDIEDDDDDDDDDEKDNDNYKIIKKKDGKVIISSKNNEKTGQTTPKHSGQTNLVGLDFDTLDMQSDEAVSHVDYSHYSKGVIYDSTNPSHKSFAQTELRMPGSLPQTELRMPGSLPLTDMSPDDTMQGAYPTDIAQLHYRSVKKSSSVTHVQPGHLNTESDVSTSPNPPPPDVASSKESAARAVTSSTSPATSNIGVLHHHDDDSTNMDSHLPLQTEDNTGFIMSYPLEFCRVDYECRAGRTCVLGVCKCYTPSMCAGHHKPICGSDGKKYASHCELHRTACVNRVHIRADRRAMCFHQEIQQHERSWLMEQERLLQEAHKNDKTQPEQSSNILAQGTAKTETESVHTNILPQEKEDTVAAVAAASVVFTDRPTAAVALTGHVLESSLQRECTWSDMGKFKDDLLMFYCQKFVEPNCKEEVKTDREYLSMLMFSYYDKNFDYFLTTEELNDKERDGHFSKNMLQNCHLHDFIKFADNLEADGRLTVSEFTSAFEPALPSIPPHAIVEVVSTLASAGNGLELKCGIDADTIVWRRHGAQLSDDKRSHQLMVFDDGALFFSTVGLHHVGNYTCMDAKDPSNAQVHRLTVQSLPVVRVTPVTQTHIAGADIELKCQAEGVPQPVITWKQRGEALEYSPHITHYYGGGHIVIHNAQVDMDTGSYTCSVHNQAGTTDKAVSVSVLPASASLANESPKDAGTFVVYHSRGISAYDPLSCLLRHEVSGDFGNFKFIPDALDGPLTLCRAGEDCQWGSAIPVGSEFIYISQPNQNRVVLMNAIDTMNPLQVIDTDQRPEKLWYVKHLDQVWVLCGNQELGDGNKTIVVIRDASQHIQHRSVHTQPVGNHFDLVENLFIAPVNDLNHEFNFGYVSHMGHNGLFKINLEDMSYTKAIDLANYGCVPVNVAFVSIGGHVIIQCVSAADQHTLQLTMDYLTDTVTSATSYNGKPMTSPDSRHLVTLDMFTGKVIVVTISDEGVLEGTHEVTVSASVSDAVFMTSMTHHGYDLVLTSAEDDDVIIMNLMTGNIDRLKGSKYPAKSVSWKSAPAQRHIVTGDSLSNFLMTTSRSSLVILDAKFKQVQCDLEDSSGSSDGVMVYIPSSLTSS